MTRKKNDTLKPLQKTEASVTEILIAGDGSLKPYIQTFHYEPENIALASLGSVLGIFEIEDQNEDSAYIVNFLASVVKKEYFAHPKRAAIESLEATLHKVNLALSELIKQDNTAWLGKLNAALCVIDKNSIHFSVSGKAKTILIRSGVLSDISEGLAEESELHPLKTFTEVSSGRVNIGDKVLLTTPGLFDIFSPQELQKNAKRFSNEQFSQFLKTALVNQLLFGSTVIIDIFEASIQKPILKKSKETEEAHDIPNVFSQSAFPRKKSSAEPEKTIAEAEQALAEETSAQEIEYTDSKTGHIYVQGDIPVVQPNETWSHIREIALDTINTTLSAAKKASSRHAKNAQVFFMNTIASLTAKKETLQKPSLEESSTDEITPTNEAPLNGNTAMTRPSAVLTATKGQTVEIWKHARTLIPSADQLKTVAKSAAPAWTVFARTATKLFPRFSVIKNEFSKLSTNQKRYAIGALFSIFIIPFIIIKFQDEPKASSVPIEEKTPIIAPKPLSQDKNVRILTSAQSILTNNTAVTTIALKGSVFAVTKNSIVNLDTPQNTQAFPLPSAFGTTITRATAMSDINTIFILTDTGKIVSFTPSNHAFADNAISLPSTENIADIATYLTYLYVLDSKNNTVYRYPRAEGGFGAQSAWLKESIEVQNTDTMSINENLYLSQTDHIIAFNKGKQDPIAFEQSATPIVFSHLFTRSGAQYLYVLDTVNGRLVQFEKSGAIIAQYSQDKLKEASSVTVDEQQKKAYFTTPSEVFSLNLE